MPRVTVPPRHGCPTCQDAAGRRARFCGSCGAALTRPSDEADGHRGARLPTVRAVVLLATAAVVLGAAASGLPAVTAPAAVTSAGHDSTEVAVGSAASGLAVVDPDVAADLRTMLRGPSPPAVAAVGGGVTVRIEGPQLLAERADTGAHAFTVDLAALTGVAAAGHVPPATLARAHAGGIVVLYGRTAVGLGLDGTLRWVRPTGVAVPDLLVATPDHVVVAGDGIGPRARAVLEVLEPDDGRIRFHRDVEAVISVEEFSALVRDLDDGTLRSIALPDGSIRWQLLPGERASAAGQGDGADG